MIVLLNRDSNQLTVLLCRYFSCMKRFHRHAEHSAASCPSTTELPSFPITATRSLNFRTFVTLALDCSCWLTTFQAVSLVTYAASPTAVTTLFANYPPPLAIPRRGIQWRAVPYVRTCVCPSVCVYVCNNFAALRRESNQCCSSTLVSNSFVGTWRKPS